MPEKVSRQVRRHPRHQQPLRGQPRTAGARPAGSAPLPGQVSPRRRGSRPVERRRQRDGAAVGLAPSPLQRRAQWRGGGRSWIKCAKRNSDSKRQHHRPLSTATGSHASWSCRTEELRLTLGQRDRRPHGRPRRGTSCPLRRFARTGSWPRLSCPTSPARSRGCRAVPCARRRRRPFP